MSTIGVPVEPQIHLGSWTNWSHGKILGATLTLTQRDGNLLIAFLALFVSFTGTSFFRLSCFALHHVLSSNLPADEVHHQRQAVLRNSASGSNAFFGFWQLLWAHRARSSRDRNPFRRLSPLLLYTTTVIAAFSVAGVFSSRIAALTGDEVLIKSPLLNVDATSLDEEIVDNFLAPYIARRNNAFVNYAQDCYSETRSKSPNCQTLVRAQLPRSIDRNASCPFDSDICRSVHGNVRIDTGLLDSHRDLGINAPESERVRIRSVIHCAPLRTDAYSAPVHLTVGSTTLPYYTYSYGPIMEGSTTIRNYTAIQQDFLIAQSQAENFFTENPRYGIQPVYASIVNGTVLPTTESSAQWYPLPSLLRNDSDIIIVFLSAKKMDYTSKVDDYWFSAHRESGRLKGGWDNSSTPIYQADDAASPLACTEQYQMCVKAQGNDSLCTPLTGVYDMFSDGVIFSSKKLNEAQINSTIAIRQRTLESSTIFLALNSLGGEVLQAKYTINDHTQVGLPADQWQTEVIRFSAMALATMQGLVVDYATGASTDSVNQVMLRPKNDQQKYLAQNQKIRSTAYTNFSILGLCITFSVGGLILLTEAILECVYVRLLWKGRDFQQYQRLEWCVNGTLQLQRLAHEQNGYGTWTNCDEDVPVLQKKEHLAVLELKDPKHPKLQAKEDRGKSNEAAIGSVHLSISPSDFLSGDDLEEGQPESDGRTYGAHNATPDMSVPDERPQSFQNDPTFLENIHYFDGQTEMTPPLSPILASSYAESERHGKDNSSATSNRSVMSHLVP